MRSRSQIRTHLRGRDFEPHRPSRTGSASPSLALQKLQSGRHTASHHDLLALQRAVGNSAVQALMARPVRSGGVGPPVAIQRKFRAGNAVKAAGRGAMSVAGFPVRRLKAAIKRMKRHQAHKSDIKAVEDLAEQLGYLELTNKKAWERDDAAISAIERKITDEAVARGLTINF